jgi:hypothetical protein
MEMYRKNGLVICGELFMAIDNLTETAPDQKTTKKTDNVLIKEI